jgi:5,5'-dehydrodivanillate O-demethylase
LLAQEENELLTRIGPGTPMGELMRRYWQPIAGTSELEKNPVKGVRILGENLTLYRDRSGRLGLIGQRCPHRSVDMKFGIPEVEGLRCPYHGWMFDETGQCIETPLEPPESTFHQRIKMVGYEVQEMGGLIWAYLGPRPAPLLPRWDLFVWEHGFRHVAATVLPCNWLQCMENSADTLHSVYLHGRLFQYALERKELAGERVSDVLWARAENSMQPRMKTDYDIGEMGLIKRRVRYGQDETSSDWTVGHPLVFPYFVRLGSGFRHEAQIRIPIDDTHTLHLDYLCYTPDIPIEPQTSIPYYEVPLKDENDEYILDYVLSQDMVAWYGQGEITDRSEEHLATSDKGVIMYRQLLKREMEKVQAGHDPINTFRDPAQNVCIDLPVGHSVVRGRHDFHKGYALAEVDKFSPVLDELVELYRRAEEAAAVAR